MPPDPPAAGTDTPEITYLDEYYLTNNEIEALKTSSREIAEMVLPGAMIIELGSGCVSLR